MTHGWSASQPLMARIVVLMNKIQQAPNVGVEVQGGELHVETVRGTAAERQKQPPRFDDLHFFDDDLKADFLLIFFQVRLQHYGIKVFQTDRQL